MNDLLPLARATVDTDALHRHDPGLLDSLRESARVVIIRDDKVAIKTDGDSVSLDVIDAQTVPREFWTPDTIRYLGRDEVAWVSMEISGRVPLDPDGMPVAHPAISSIIDTREFESLRKVGDRLNAHDAGLASAATSLAAWHRYYKHCPNCGTALHTGAGGWEKSCPACLEIHYPRTDPSVIMAIRDSRDRLLLGHAAHWPEGRYSCLAGFVESGESLERAVRRESHEEAGIVIGKVEYFASQPWPFPRSLMMAFRAWTDADDADVHVDGREITSAKFFTRDELRSAVGNREITIPMASSVARALIEDWNGGPISEPPERAE